MNKEEAKKQIDEVINQLEWRRGGWTDDVKNDRTTARTIIDKIEPDHSKVELPRDVGEELEDWLENDSVDTIITDLVCVSEGDPQAVRDWWDSTLDATYLIADMARYGWEAEKEALYNIKVKFAQDSYYYKTHALGKPIVRAFQIAGGNKLDGRAAFTIAEIAENGLQDCEKEEVSDD